MTLNRDELIEWFEKNKQELKEAGVKVTELSFEELLEKIEELSKTKRKQLKMMIDKEDLVKWINTNAKRTAVAWDGEKALIPVKDVLEKIEELSESAKVEEEKVESQKETEDIIFGSWG